MPGGIRLGRPGAFRLRAERHGQVRGSAQVHPAVPGDLAVEGESREPGGQPGEGDRGLEPGQRRTQAVMRAAAERDVLARVVPVEPEIGGVRPPETLVPVGRAHIAQSITGEYWKGQALTRIAEAVAVTDLDRVVRTAQSITKADLKALALAGIARAAGAVQAHRNSAT